MRAFHDGSTSIGCLRVRAAGDAAALRMRSEAVLRPLDLHPAGMPEHSILCIRRIDDPLPGGVNLASSQGRRPLAWEGAMRTAVERAFAAAARPILGAVPADANAILFTDRVELLACAARDAVHRHLDAWWWRYILPDLSFEGVVREWMRGVAHVPAAIAILALSSDAIPFVRHLSAADALSLSTEVLRIHGAETLARSVVESLAHHTESRATIAARQALTQQAPAPWAAFAREFDREALSIEQRLFGALALTLWRARGLVRSNAFGREVTSWLAAELDREERVAAEQHPSGQEEPAIPRTVPVISRTSVGQNRDDVGGGVPAIERRDAEEESSDVSESMAADPAAEDARVLRFISRGEPPRRLVHESRSADSASDHLPVPVPLRQVRRVIPAVSPPRFPDEAPAFTDEEERRIIMPPPSLDDSAEAAVESSMAGVFFLLNVAIGLGIYADFTGRAHDGLALDPWDFLALTSRAMVPSIDQDPVWPLLAQLGNREEPLRLEFVPPEPERVAACMQSARESITHLLDGEQPEEFLIAQRGRIAVSHAHVDVFFSLQMHPIEIRMAGLDRDPGWIPAAGRHVAFHFD